MPGQFLIISQIILFLLKIVDEKSGKFLHYPFIIIWCNSEQLCKFMEQVKKTNRYPDADPDPAIFVIDLQDTNKKLILKKFCLLLFEGTFTIHNFLR